MLRKGNQALFAQAASVHLLKPVANLLRSVELLVFRLGKLLSWAWYLHTVSMMVCFRLWPLFLCNCTCYAWHPSSQFILKCWFIKQSPGVVGHFLPAIFLWPLLSSLSLSLSLPNQMTWTRRTQGRMHVLVTGIATFQFQRKQGTKGSMALSAYVFVWKGHIASNADALLSKGARRPHSAYNVGKQSIV